MAVLFKLPKLDVDAVVVLNTPVDGADNVLANGVLTVLDEAGNDALILKATDWLNFKYDAYTAGTANVVEVDLSLVTIVNNGVYTLTISAPYAVSFFTGGTETNAVYQPRTYTVSLDATATTQELLDAFLARINADTFAYFTAADLGGNVLEITENNPGYGPLNVVAPSGATVADAVGGAWVSPVGSANEVLQYVPNNTTVLSTGQYNRFIITYRKLIRHNIVNGLQVVKPVRVLVYTDSNDAGTAAFDAGLTTILSGAGTAADYLGCPQV
jgi:hypothetical protein